jgi:DNA-directed RNA polymerase subunit A'
LLQRISDLKSDLQYLVYNLFTRMSSFFTSPKKSHIAKPVLQEKDEEVHEKIIRKPKKFRIEDIVKDYKEDDEPASNVFLPTSRLKPVIEHNKPVKIAKDDSNSLSIDSIRFSFMSDEEVKAHSVIQITETKLGGPNSLYDLRLGPLNNHETCETCHAEWKLCPGHFGYIALAVKIPHPLRSKVVLDFLHLFCYNENCNRLVISEDRINLLGIDKLSGDAKFNKILKEVYKNIKVCPHCNFVLPKFTCEEDKYFMVLKEKKYFLSYNQIENTFSNIPEQDIDYIGLDSRFVHPSRVLIGNLPVVPPCVRMIVRGDDAVNHDDLFYQYTNILKANMKLEEFIRTKKSGTPIPQDLIDGLVFNIKTLMDNSKGKARSSAGKRSIKCIKKRLSGKSGLIRGNMQGKRVDFCARTVITPEAMGMLDEVVVPEHIAKVITFPVRVNDLNIKKCQDLLDNGKVRKIKRGDTTFDADIACFTKGFEIQDTDVIVTQKKKRFTAISYRYAKDKEYVLRPGDVVVRCGKVIENVQPPRKKDFKLQIGDVIDRQLQDGDWTVFNRQPTLWKGSMRAKKVKIRPGLTFRFSLSSTKPFNAD